MVSQKITFDHKRLLCFLKTIMFPLKGIYHCQIEIIKGLTDKGQFQYLTKLKGPQVGIYLYTAQFLSLR